MKHKWGTIFRCSNNGNVQIKNALFKVRERLVSRVRVNGSGFSVLT